MITVPESLPDGRTVQREQGLIVVTEVTDAVSLGQVRYLDGEPDPGTSVTEVPRFGLDVTPYLLASLPADDLLNFSVYGGLRLTLSKGTMNVRPVVSVEWAVYPFSVFENWFQLRPFLGVEIRAYFGRFEIAALPMVGIEEWFGLSAGAETSFQGFGLRALVELSLLLSRDIKVSLHGGYDYWFDGRQGYLAGGGISLKL